VTLASRGGGAGRWGSSGADRQHHPRLARLGRLAEWRTARADAGRHDVPADRLHPHRPRDRQPWSGPDLHRRWAHLVPRQRGPHGGGGTGGERADRGPFRSSTALPRKLDRRRAALGRWWTHLGRGGVPERQRQGPGRGSRESFTRAGRDVRLGRLPVPRQRGHVDQHHHQPDQRWEQPGPGHRDRPRGARHHSPRQPPAASFALSTRGSPGAGSIRTTRGRSSRTPRSPPPSMPPPTRPES
jgi:hypothetical protein